LLGERAGATAILSDEKLLADLELGEAVPFLSASTMRGGQTTRAPQRSGAIAWIVVGLGVVAAAALAIGWLSGPRSTRPPPVFAHAERDAGVDAYVEEESNRWIAVEGGSDRLGVGDQQLDARQSGFRPSADVRAPGRPYSIQQHEVTWGELEEWLADRSLPILDRRPTWLPAERPARAHLPVTGIPWGMAHEYCVSIGGSLPTEEEWEHAARGVEQRSYAWGDAPIDPERSNIGPRAYAHPVEVMTRDQDRTPGPRENAIYDLMGNAQEWTLDVWRSNEGRPEQFGQSDGLIYRAVRGLPLANGSPWSPPEEAPAAFRMRLCASGRCPEATDAILADVGFRCVRE
jgi:formylglycine-generating enzyme required for sulfatase activity